MATPRDDLLARAISHVAEHGLSDRSLRELAAGIGTSHRMLLYHFGDRTGLVSAIVASMEARQRALLDELASTATTPAEVIRAQWARLTDPELRPFVHLFVEVLALALHERPGTEGFLDGLTAPWVDLGTEIARRLGHDLGRTDVLVGIAVVRGLLIELAAGADEDEIGAALDRFVELWERDGPRPLP